MKVSEVEGKEGSVRGQWRYKYLDQEGETKMCQSPSSVCFLVLLYLRFTGRHGERWMDWEKEETREMEECVAAHSRAKSTLTASIAKRRVMSASSLHFLLSLYSWLLFHFLVNLFFLFLPLAAAVPFLTYSRIYQEIYSCKIEVWPEPTLHKRSHMQILRLRLSYFDLAGLLYSPTDLSWIVLPNKSLFLYFTRALGVPVSCLAFTHIAEFWCQLAQGMKDRLDISMTAV